MNNNKWYFTLSSIMFVVIAISHYSRMTLGMEAVMFGVPVPLWISGAFVIISGYLATRGFMEAHKIK